MNYKDGFMFALFVMIMFGVGAYVGHGVGMIDGALEQKRIDNNKLQQANTIIAGDLYANGN